MAFFSTRHWPNGLFLLPGTDQMAFSFTVHWPNGLFFHRALTQWPFLSPGTDHMRAAAAAAAAAAAGSRFGRWRKNLFEKKYPGKMTFNFWKNRVCLKWRFKAACKKSRKTYQKWYPQPKLISPPDFYRKTAHGSWYEFIGESEKWPFRETFFLTFFLTAP